MVGGCRPAPGVPNGEASPLRPGAAPGQPAAGHASPPRAAGRLEAVISPRPGSRSASTRVAAASVGMGECGRAGGRRVRAGRISWVPPTGTGTARSRSAWRQQITWSRLRSLRGGRLRPPRSLSADAELAGSAISSVRSAGTSVDMEGYHHPGGGGPGTHTARRPGRSLRHDLSKEGQNPKSESGCFCFPSPPREQARGRERLRHDGGAYRGGVAGALGAIISAAGQPLQLGACDPGPARASPGP